MRDDATMLDCDTFKKEYGLLDCDDHLDAWILTLNRYDTEFHLYIDTFDFKFIKWNDRLSKCEYKRVIYNVMIQYENKNWDIKWWKIRRWFYAKKHWQNDKIAFVSYYDIYKKVWNGWSCLVWKQSYSISRERS